MVWETRYHVMPADVRRQHLQIFVTVIQFRNSEEQFFFFLQILICAVGKGGA